MKDLLNTLDALTSAPVTPEDPRDVLLDVAERVVRFVSNTFGTTVDEVAILVLTTDGRHLRFAAPRKFADLGTIPITKRDSIAVNILGRKQGEALNNVRMVKHVAFFESVKLRDRAEPIQKMITVPILADDKAIGVAQVSRKGETPAAAGHDFTDNDVRRAQEIFASVAPFLQRAVPAKF